LAVKHDVFRLDVHVRHTQAVGVGQVLQQAARNLSCCCLCEGCTLADVLKQLATCTGNIKDTPNVFIPRYHARRHCTLTIVAAAEHSPQLAAGWLAYGTVRLSLIGLTVAGCRPYKLANTFEDWHHYLVAALVLKCIQQPNSVGVVLHPQHAAHLLQDTLALQLHILSALRATSRHNRDLRQNKTTIDNWRHPVAAKRYTV
jgi:hypothetical protein